MSNSKPSTTWVVVADSRNIKIFANHNVLHKDMFGGSNKHHYYQERITKELELVAHETLDTDLTVNDNRTQPIPLDGDKSLRSARPVGDGMLRELTRRFIKTMALKLNHAYEEKKFQDLIIVAAGKTGHELRQQLTIEVQKKVSAVVTKDLVHCDSRALETHLNGALSKANAA